MGRRTVLLLAWLAVGLFLAWIASTGHVVLSLVLLGLAAVATLLVEV